MHNVKAMTMEHAVTTGGQHILTKARASHVASVAGAQQPHGQVGAHDPQSEGLGEESPGLHLRRRHLRGLSSSELSWRRLRSQPRTLSSL